MKKYFFILLCFAIGLEASYDVVKARYKISYKQKITKSNIYKDKTPKIKKYCIPISVEDILSTQYRAKKYIKRDEIICTKDVYKLKTNNRLLFNFGAIQIEKDGKIIRETKDYVRIKNDNGEVQKIYKNGRSR